MGYLKFSAEELFTGYEILDASKVLVTDEAGTIIEITTRENAGSNVQLLNGILSPGFINCHCHLELSHMKGLIPQNTGLIDFVFKVVTQRHFAEEEIVLAVANAEEEMLANGIVAVGDICNNTTTLEQKVKQHLHYYNFVEASGWLPHIAETRFERSFDYYQQFLNSSANILKQNSTIANETSIVPHAPYSVSENLWRRITPYFTDKVVSIHNQETSFEDELFLQGSGDFIRMYQMMNLDSSFLNPAVKAVYKLILPS